MKIIKGMGGGGGGSSDPAPAPTPRTPVEAPDTLSSKQYARFLDVLSEGEIGGLVNGLRSVYYNQVPLQNANGTYNFQGVSVVERKGTQSQSYVPGFPAVEVETNVGVEVKSESPIIRNITSSIVDHVRVTLSVSALVASDTNTGDRNPTSVIIKISLQVDGGSYVQYVYDTIAGKTESKFQKAYLISLPAGTSYNIKVERLTPDSESIALRNNTFWDSYTTIVDTKFALPNTAYLATSIDASMFNSIPTRGYECMGKVDVKIPANYNPYTRTYSGVWDGTFKTDWTNDPAWIYYDIITSPRYGLGEYIDSSQVDKWTLYEISKYCSEYVPDGFGGVEPRFSCSIYIQTREEAHKVLQSLASVFRGVSYWGGGSIMTFQDAPSNTFAYFNPSNVINGEFSYQGTSAKNRVNSVLVSWNDPVEQYRQKFEYVEDEESIARYGTISTEVPAFGCTSRGQAHRVGKSVIYTDKYETEVISFATGLEGFSEHIAPGTLIKTVDPNRSGIRFGGRVVSATTSEITLDDEVEIESGVDYILTCVLPDGSSEDLQVIKSPGTTNVLEVSPAFSEAPTSAAIWTLTSSNVEPEMWRIISISEADNGVIEISALSYNPSKYALIDYDAAFEPLNTTLIPAGTVAPPTNITYVESLYKVSTSTASSKISLSWQGNTPYYDVVYSKEGEASEVKRVTEASFEILNTSPGTYYVSVYSVDALLNRSTPTNITISTLGLYKTPADVTGFNMVALNGQAHLSWDKSTDLDVIVGGYARIRYAKNIAEPLWDRSIDIGPQVPGGSTQTVLPLMNGTYLIKWVDGKGISSVNPTVITTTASSVINLNVFEELQESPTFGGTHENTAVVIGGMLLDSSETIDEQLENMDNWPRLSALGGISTEGTYYFENDIDLGGVLVSRLSVDMVVQGLEALDYISERGLVSGWVSVDGAVIDNITSSIEMRFTNDDPTGSPVWSNWTKFIIGDYTARAFQFRVVLKTLDPTQNIIVSELKVVVDMPDRVYTGEDIESGIGTYTVTYPQEFKISPNIGITAQDMSTGDYYRITNKSTAGFDITFYNSSASVVNRTFDHYSKGY